MKRWEDRDEPTVLRLWDARERALDTWRSLTAIEQELSRHIAVGRPQRSIAAVMGCSVHGVVMMRRRLAQKIGLPSGAKTTRELAVLVRFVDAA